ncbi:MAG: hypothetical protein IT561_00610 [Alphaproteobacteria bacterium]|nr:hypothetical protein [Alphaproteobacteria bacterium]
MKALPRRFATTAWVVLLVAGCGSSPPPASETTAYQCGLGRGFSVVVRPGSERVVLDTGRQRLLLPRAEGDAKAGDDAKVATTGRYVLGGITLQLQGEEATLEGALGGPYEGCRAAGPPVSTPAGAPPLKIE